MFQSSARPAEVDVVPGSVATSTVDERLAFLKRVYGWMTAALLVTGLGAMISIQSGITESMMFSGGWAGRILMFLGWIGLAYAARAVRHKPGINIAVYGAYALFTGMVISSIVLVAMMMAKAQGMAAGTYVLQALGITTVVFGGLTVYTMTTKRDFTWLRGFLFAALLGLIVGGIVHIFVGGTVFGLVLSILGVMIFSGYVLYDTQRIMKTYPNNEHVAASLELFLDFVLLFVHILRVILYIAAMSRE